LNAEFHVNEQRTASARQPTHSESQAPAATEKHCKPLKRRSTCRSLELAYLQILYFQQIHIKQIEIVRSGLPISYIDNFTGEDSRYHGKQMLTSPTKTGKMAVAYFLQYQPLFIVSKETLSLADFAG